jgi:hypothetical protein
MTRPYLPFIAFLTLLLLTIPFSFDFATSVVPGWHTTIYPPYFIWTLALVVVLLFVVIGYWLISKRVDKTNWTLFIIHHLLTIPTVIFIKFPSILLDVHQTDRDELIRSLALRVKLIPWAEGLFVVGQIFFLVYFIRTIRRKPHTT